MQAIKTKYIGPTNHRGTRIKAECCARTITVSWDYELDVEANHVKACKTLVDALRWPNDFTTGCLKSGDYVHVPITTRTSKGRK